MASGEETFQSREGTQQGFDGLLATRMFRVTLNSVTDDPIETLTTEAAGEALNLGVGIGHQHPNPNVPLFVRTHVVRQRLTVLSWLVEAIYGISEDPADIPQLEHPDLPGWLITVRSVSEQIERRTSIAQVAPPVPEKLIGVPFFAITSSLEQPLSPEDLAESHFETNTDCNTIQLTRRCQVYPKPVAFFKPKSLIVLRRTFPTYDYSVIGIDILEQIKQLSFNEQPFLGLPRGTVKMVDWEVSERNSVVQESTGLPVVFDVTLAFEIDMTTTIKADHTGVEITGHSKLQLVYTHTDDNGNESLVTDTTHAAAAFPVAFEDFNMGIGANYNAILGAFEVFQTP